MEGQSKAARDAARVGAALDEHLEPLVVVPVDQRSRVELHQNVFHGDWLGAIDRLVAEEVLDARLGDLSAAVQEDSHLFQVARLGRVKERSLLTGSRLHVGVRAAVEKLDELAGRIIVVHANRVDGGKALAVELIDRVESPLVLRVRGGLVHGATQESPVSDEKVHFVLLVAKVESNGRTTRATRHFSLGRHESLRAVSS